MSNSYSMEYGYKSLIYPARMFKTREDAQTFDGVESLTAICGRAIDLGFLEGVAKGTLPEYAQENGRVILAAMRWIVNAADDAGQAKRLAEYHARLANDAAEVETVGEIAQQAEE